MFHLKRTTDKFVGGYARKEDRIVLSCTSSKCAGWGGVGMKEVNAKPRCTTHLSQKGGTI
jgi:hypothetical protein